MVDSKDLVAGEDLFPVLGKRQYERLDVYGRASPLGF